MHPFYPESIEVGSHLYLTAAPGIEVGTPLRGGHFRKAVEEGAASDHGSILELVWELVRAREFPSRPCRFDVLFLWQDEANARAWHHHQTILGPETGSERGLYQVEVERIGRIWAADMDLISYIGKGETVAEECLSGKRRFRPVLICDREAAHYWQLPTCWDGRLPGEWSLAGT